MTTTVPASMLSQLDLDILASTYLHRMLTTRQLHDLHAPGRLRLVQRAGARLEDAGYLARTRSQPPGGRQSHWFHTELGATVTAASCRVPDRAFRMDTHRARTSHHLKAVNEVGVAMVQAARAAGDGFTWRSWTHEIAHSIGPGQADVVIADAVFTYDRVTSVGTSSRWRFVELDRGTEPVHQLVAKIRDYTALAGYQPAKRADTSHLPRLAWRRHYPVLPGVLFVFADLDAGQAGRRLEALAGFVAADPVLSRTTATVDVTATTLEQLRAPGPHAPIFTRIPTLEPVPL